MVAPVDVTFIADGTLATNATTTTLAITAPGSLVTGDILVASIYGNNNQVVTVPGGASDGISAWAKVAETNSGTGVRSTIAWARVTDGSLASGNIINFTKPVDDNLLFAGAISVWRGVKNTGDPTAVAGGPTNNALPAQTPISFTAFAPSKDCCILGIVVYGNDLTTPATPSDSNPPTWTKRADQETSAGADCSIWIFQGVAENTGGNVGVGSHAPNATAGAAVVCTYITLAPGAYKVVGNQPASTGTLAKARLKTLTGAQPAATGTLAQVRTSFVALAGAQPAASGTIQASQGPVEVTVSGNQPAATGTLAHLRTSFVALAGAQPAASGTIAHLRTSFVALAGNQPAATGTIAHLRTSFVALAGAQPAASGSIAADRLLTHISVAGSQPASTGALAVDRTLTHIALAGDQPAASGTIAGVKALFIDLAGSQPAGSGSLAFDRLLQHVTLTGAQPTATGALAADVVLRHVSLAGAQPAATGALTFSLLLHVLLSGSQPAASGTLVALAPTNNVGFAPVAGTARIVREAVGRGAARGEHLHAGSARNRL